MSIEETVSTAEAKKDSSSSFEQVEKDLGISEPFINEASLFKRVDMHLLFFMMITYGFQFMDKLALSSAAVYGLKKDLHLHGTQYSWTSSVFYFGYLLGNIIVARIIQIVPTSKLASISVCLWGICLACTAGCTSFATLMVARFFLGLFESVVSPTFVFMTSIWWKQNDRSAKTGLWVAGNDIGSFISSFIIFGIGHIHGSISVWQIIFILYGLLTFLWSFVLFFFLPDSPQTVKWLSKDEKDYYKANIVGSTVAHQWNWTQARQIMFDPTLWVLIVTVFLGIFPNSGLTSYGFIILNDFGFSSIQTSLINIPASLIAWIAIVGSGYVGSRFKNTRCLMIFVVNIISIVGGLMCYKCHTKGAKLAGYFLVSVQPAVYPQALAIAASNFRGTTRKSIANSTLFVIYCASSIAGPQLFKYTDAPNYSPAFLAWVICFCILALHTGIMAAYFSYRNKKQAEKEQTLPEGDISELAEYMDPTFRFSF